MTETIGIFAIHMPGTTDFGLTKAVIFKPRLSKCLFSPGFSKKCLIMSSSEIDHSYIVDFMLTPSLRHDFFVNLFAKNAL
ncbi:hypothetical protein GCM10023345_23650 [Acinetobacter kookii]